MRIGLTGGLASGASEVARYLASKGFQILSGDKAGHEALRTANVKSALVERFGYQILDSSGEIDRKILGTIVFSDDQARADLNRIIHPILLRNLQNDITRIETDVGVVFVDAALIYEWDLQNYFDVMIVVDAPLKERISRAVSRDKTPEAAVKQRIAAQIPLENKVKQADYVINNNGSINDLKRKTDQILSQILPSE